MNDNIGPQSASQNVSSSPLFAPILATVLCWVAIRLGFLGLNMLMQERPEFVGEPRGASKVVLVQESPRIVGRKRTDDVSVIKSMQPNSSQIRFNMSGRRDYRGLKTISDMSGQFSGRFTVTNGGNEPMFVLFRCPHPRTDSNDRQSFAAGGLKLQASVPGVQENATNAWLWSGALAEHASATIEISYQAASLKGAVYRIDQQAGIPLNQVQVNFDRQDLSSMNFESGDGAIPDTNPAGWKRENFLGPDFFSASIVESRSLFTSLQQLLEIGPLISLLFLATVVAIILARQGLTAIQVFTISAGYAFYFPLVLYLSSRLSFGLALAIAFVIPGALLVNYARWLLGGRLGVMGGALFLALYQIFPTLAVFAGWKRGMVLLGLGVVTLAVLINLQNKTLRRRAATAAALLALLAQFPFSARGAEVQVILPAELSSRVVTQKVEKTSAILAYEPATYDIRQEATHFRIEARLTFQALRTGEIATPLFAAPVHLQESKLESSETNLAQLVTVSNRLSLFVQQPGKATLSIIYRAPIENHDGKKRAQIPVFIGPAGNARLESPRNDLEVLAGNVWTRTVADKGTVYEIGIAGQETLALEWTDQPGAGRSEVARQIEGGNGLYGIGLTRVQNLTVINSDGSCTHFAECEVPAFQKEEFRLRLPANARLISASINGTEVTAPIVDDRLCRIRLPDRAPNQTGYRLSFRLAYPAVRLGFFGSIELSLPELLQTAGTLEWVVALPDGFDTQVTSSGLETQKAAPDLATFGDYGRVLKGHQQTFLAKTLAPPATINLNLRYRQIVPGMTDLRAE